MAIQPDIPFAAQVLGTLGTTCWCVQLLPQIWQNHRRGHCAGFPALTVFIWAVSEVPFGAYVIIQGHAIPLQLQPQIFGALCLICWGQCLCLSGKWSKAWAVFWVFLVAVSMAVMEFVLIWTLRPGFQAGNTLPTRVVWGFAAAGLVIGLLPQYVEQFKRGGRNLGFNWVFLTVDIAGALFSFLAMAVRQRFDMYGGILYIIVMALEVGFIVLHACWWLHAGMKAKNLNLAFDEYVRKLDEAEGIVHREQTPFWSPLYHAVFCRMKGSGTAPLKSNPRSSSVTSIGTMADVEKNVMAPLES